MFWFILIFSQVCIYEGLDPQDDAHLLRNLNSEPNWIFPTEGTFPPTDTPRNNTMGTCAFSSHLEIHNDLLDGRSSEENLDAMPSLPNPQPIVGNPLAAEPDWILPTEGTFPPAGTQHNNTMGTSAFSGHLEIPNDMLNDRSIEKILDAMPSPPNPQSILGNHLAADTSLTDDTTRAWLGNFLMSDDEEPVQGNEVDNKEGHGSEVGNLGTDELHGAQPVHGNHGENLENIKARFMVMTVKI